MTWMEICFPLATRCIGHGKKRKTKKKKKETFFFSKTYALNVALRKHDGGILGPANAHPDK